MRRSITRCALALVCASPFGCGLWSTRPNPEHCWHAYGDFTCWVEFGDRARFCSTDAAPCNNVAWLGCVASRPIDDECYSPCGGGLSLIDDPSCPSAGSDDADAAGLDQPAQPPCETDADCPSSAAPVCADGSCVECSAANVEACALPSAGCELATNTCLTCSDCELGWCSVAGVCLTHAVHVDGDGGRDFLTIEAALDSLGPFDATIVVHELDDGGAYPLADALTLTQASLALVAAPREAPSITTATGQFAVVVDDASLQLAGLRIIGHGGVRALGDADVVLDEVVLHTSRTAALIQGGRATIRNSMISGFGVASSPAVFVGDGELELVYSTVVALDGVTSNGDALYCGAQARGRARNSLIADLGDGDGLRCDAAELELQDNALEQPRAGNLTIAGVSPLWFVDVEYGDLHILDPGAPALAISSQWQPGDPRFDIDGDPRSLGVGWVGADVP